MNELQRVLRFSQGRQQTANVVQTELDSSLLGSEKPVDSRIISCVHIKLRQVTSPLSGSRATKSGLSATAFDAQSDRSVHVPAGIRQFETRAGDPGGLFL